MVHADRETDDLESPTTRRHRLDDVDFVQRGGNDGISSGNIHGSQW
jgi:hypothetical protein